MKIVQLSKDYSNFVQYQLEVQSVCPFSVLGSHPWTLIPTSPTLNFHTCLLVYSASSLSLSSGVYLPTFAYSRFSFISSFLILDSTHLFYHTASHPLSSLAIFPPPSLSGHSSSSPHISLSPHSFPVLFPSHVPPPFHHTVVLYPLTTHPSFSCDAFV